LPSGFVRDDGEVLGAHLLSTGTQDVLGLAIRLAMAEFFLDGKQGFLVMDDPLVDMDPSRQQQAASLLRNYAEENGRQVIVFTCFPGHAEMLGGRVVGL
jgi:DNA repair protein SbcC/Rad50